MSMMTCREDMISSTGRRAIGNTVVLLHGGSSPSYSFIYCLFLSPRTVRCLSCTLDYNCILPYLVLCLFFQFDWLGALSVVLDFPPTPFADSTPNEFLGFKTFCSQTLLCAPGPLSIYLAPVCQPFSLRSSDFSLENGIRNRNPSSRYGLALGCLLM